MCVFDSFVHTKNKIKPNSLNSNNKSEERRSINKTYKSQHVN